jgi:ABC-type transporter MlaC component
MKKLIVCAAIFATVYSTSANAQQAGASSQSNTTTQNNDAAMAERVRQTKATLVEKAKITEEQAEKIMQINIEARKSLGDIRSLSEEDRKAKITAMEADRDKKYKEVLSEEQFAAVKNAFADMKKQAAGERKVKD